MTYGNHCPANVTDVPWFDFRLVSEFVKQTYTKHGPMINCLLRLIIGVTHRTIYPDWMHDKNLGSDKVSRGDYMYFQSLQLIVLFSTVVLQVVLQDVLQSLNQV